MGENGEKYSGHSHNKSQGTTVLFLLSSLLGL